MGDKVRSDDFLEFGRVLESILIPKIHDFVLCSLLKLTYISSPSGVLNYG